MRAVRTLSLSLFSATMLLTTGPVMAAQLASHPPLLTTARQVHELPPTQAAGRLVNITGVVTYYDPSDSELFLQDASGGVFVETSKPHPIRAGQEISVQGFAAPGYRTDVGRDPEIRVVGNGKMPDALPATYEVLASGQADCKLVRLRGVVRAVTLEHHENGPLIHMNLQMPGGEVEVYQRMSGAAADALTLLDSTVEAVGVAGGAFDAKFQLTGVILYARNNAAIHVIQPADRNAQALPLTGVDQVFQSRWVVDQSRRLRVRGTLTYYMKGDTAVLEDYGKSIVVQTRETKDLPIGELVDALGFASDQEYAPSLRQAELYDVGKRHEITPRPVSYREAQSGRFTDNLISVEGTLISELHGVHLETIVLKVEDHFITGRLEGEQSLPDLRIGSRVRLSGICRIVAGGPWRAPMFFRLDMRSPADLRLLSAPSWWTVTHLIVLVGTLLILAAVVSAWAMLLRRRVREQTSRIQRSMVIARRRSSLLEKISSNDMPQALLEEICRCVTELLPGTSCRYQLDALKIPELPGRSAPNHQDHSLLYTTILLGTEENIVGQLSVFASHSKLQLETPKEVFAMMSEVASLAIQQSLLYQGLVHHSTHDALTELPNRRLCDYRLSLALDEAAQKRTSVDVIYIDVDRFKHVNDRFGHRIGDLYLKEISCRLTQETRSTDTLARVGGDEFIVIAPQAAAAEPAVDLRFRLQHCFSTPFYLEGERIDGSASVGVASYPEHGTTAEDLKRHADHEMYLCKRSISDDELSSAPEISVVTQKELEEALDRGQFRLAYQPQFAADGQLRGMEALVRLEDPILGLLTPDAFIALAERCDVILELGRWVLEQGMRDFCSWRLQSGPPVLLVVNVSMRQAAHADFAEGVFASLRKCGFPADRLELELTERTLSDCDEILKQLRQLIDAGIRISMDDFGTGQSSLSLLHRLPIDTIKIDRSFIAAMPTEPEVIPVIEAIAGMARSLGKRIVAEGIEDAAMIPKLLRMAPMDFQGYLLSRPVPSQQIAEHLPRWLAGAPMVDQFSGLMTSTADEPRP